MKSKQCSAIETLLRRSKSLRTHDNLQQELNKKRKQNAQEYKLPTVVQMIVRPEKIIVEKTVCYKLGMGETCVLYLHGGSYVDPPLVFHWRFLQQLSRETDVTVYLPLYGRVPQHHCYSTVTHMKQVYMHLVNLYGAQNIVVMGDSAGGGLALALCEYLAVKGCPQPRQMILFSPWVDVDLTGDYSESQKTDFVLNIDELRFFGACYRHKLPVGHYMASPLFGLTDKLAPMHVFVGGAELFYPDCKKLQEYALQKGVDFTLYDYPEMQHVFLLYPIPEAKTARKQVEELLEQPIIALYDD